jgi:hypothetical protein
MRFAAVAGLDHDTRRRIYHQALLRYIGCNADTHLLAAHWGDEILFAASFITSIWATGRHVRGSGAQTRYYGANATSISLGQTPRLEQFEREERGTDRAAREDGPVHYW